MFKKFNPDEQQNKKRESLAARGAGLLKFGKRKSDTQELDYEEIAARQAEMRAAAEEAAAREEAERLAAAYEVDREAEGFAAVREVDREAEGFAAVRESDREAEGFAEVHEVAENVSAEKKGSAKPTSADKTVEDPVHPMAVNGWEHEEIKERKREKEELRGVNTAKQRNRKRLLIGAAAFVLLLAVIFGGFWYMTFTVGATATTEGDAPIVFYLNHRDQVLRAKPLNDEADALLKSMGDLGNRPDLWTVLAMTEKAMHERGLLAEDEHLKYIIRKGRGGDEKRVTDEDDIVQFDPDSGDSTQNWNDSQESTTAKPKETKATTSGNSGAGGGDNPGSDTGGGETPGGGDSGSGDSSGGESSGGDSGGGDSSGEGGSGGGSSGGSGDSSGGSSGSDSGSDDSGSGSDNSGE